MEKEFDYVAHVMVPTDHFVSVHLQMECKGKEQKKKSKTLQNAVSVILVRKESSPINKKTELALNWSHVEMQLLACKLGMAKNRIPGFVIDLC